MGKIKKGEHRGVEFSSDYQPKNRRKPKIFSILKKKYGIDLGKGMEEYTPGQMKDLLQGLLCMDPRETLIVNQLLTDSIKQMKESFALHRDVKVQNDERLNQVFISLNTAISKETQIGRSDTIRWIIEYLYGKATQPIEGDINTNVSTSLDLSRLTTDELNQYNTLLEKISKGGNKEIKDGKE